MTPEELQRRRVSAFRALAEKELEAARLLGPRHAGQAAYFLQQCVEKLVRGVLETRGIAVGPTHQILQLARMLGADDPLAATFAELDELSVAATRYRYPSPNGEVRSMKESDLLGLLARVETLFELVAPMLDRFSGRV
jgi:HEPN domain-containing protein